MNNHPYIRPRITRVASNRHNKRLVTREYEKIKDALFPIEDTFMDFLFESEWDYNSLYQIYLEEYIKMATWLTKFGKIRICQVDETYFHDIFAPIEQNSQLPIYDTFRRITNKIRSVATVL